MKKLYVVALISLSIVACNQSTESTETKTNGEEVKTIAQSDNPTSTKEDDAKAINEAVHGFYKWYDLFVLDDKRNVTFIDAESKPAKLNEVALNKYHSELMKSGFLSKNYIDNSTAYLKKQEMAWQKNNESNDDGPLSGLDADIIFCGQDWDLKRYTSGTLSIQLDGADKASTSIESSNIELIKENGKWLITKIECK